MIDTPQDAPTFEEFLEETSAAAVPVLEDWPLAEESGEGLDAGGVAEELGEEFSEHPSEDVGGESAGEQLLEPFEEASVEGVFETIEPGLEPATAENLSEDSAATVEPWEPLLVQLREAVRDGNKDAEAQLRQDITAYAPARGKREWQKKISLAVAQGKTCKKLFKQAQTLLRDYLSMSTEVKEFWQIVSEAHPFFSSQLHAMIMEKLQSDCRKTLEIQGKPAAQSLMDRAEAVYEDCKQHLQPIILAYNEHVYPILPTIEHRIQCLEPCAEWMLYIDETGTKFASKDKVARIAGVLLPANTELPKLDKKFHASEAAIRTTLRNFRMLLHARCGIFGLCYEDMRTSKKDDWLGSVLELALWVWRLLPLPKKGNVRLSVYIEQRAQYMASAKPGWFAKALALRIEQECAVRRQRIEMGEVLLVSKGTRHIAWADVIAYMWGSSRTQIKAALRESKLAGPCLLHGAGKLLIIWEKILHNQPVDAAEWQKLMEQPPVEGSITEQTLDMLQEFCVQNPQYWQRYMDAVARSFASKSFDCAVLKRQCAWLARMCGAKKGSDMDFLWKILELAQSIPGTVSVTAQKEIPVALDMPQKEASMVSPPPPVSDTLGSSTSFVPPPPSPAPGTASAQGTAQEETSSSPETPPKETPLQPCFKVKVEGHFSCTITFGV